MSDALTGPFEVATLVLLVAGIAKLRSPSTARRALDALGLPASTLLVRALAAGEVALATALLIKPAAPTALALACVYGVFALVALALVRRRATCGCFGESDAPASLIQAALSAAFAGVALLSGAAGAHGIAWIAHRPVLTAVTIAIGTAGAAYATVLAYTTLPQAWTAWEPR